MNIGVGKIAARVWGQLLPEREIYLRSNGRVRYLSLTPQLQLIFGIGGLVAIAWISFASIYFAVHQERLAARDKQIAEMQTNYFRLTSELANVIQKNVIQKNVTQNNSAGMAATEINPREGAIIASDVGSQVDGQPPVEVSAAKSPSAVAPEKSFTSDVLPRPRPERPRNTVSNIQKEILPRARPRRPSVSLPDSMTAISGNAYTLDNAAPPGLERRRYPDTTKIQDDVIGYLASDAKTAAVALEKLINLTGLDADTMLRRQGEGSLAEGGPLLKLPPSMEGKLLRRIMPGDIAVPVTRKGRVEILREALFSLPLAEPVDKYYISSGYGYRRDPFTRAKAFHSGVDMVAPHGHAVRSSAPGTIVFAGRNGPYGNMVEVDHGNGVKSRYGHLSKITVNRGQRIGLRDLIGLVGNTGRSGTAHLHFEVWFDGKPRDPRNFLKAGENVFQRQG